MNGEQLALFTPTRMRTRASVDDMHSGRHHVLSFIDNFDVLAEAPEGMKALRQLILDLAIRGRLVPQDPADEPAALLLPLVEQKRSRLAAQRKAGKGEDLPPVDGSEQPYSLPQGWIWVRLGKATICRDGERVPLSKDERAPRKGPHGYYGASGIIDEIDDYIFDAPLLLIGEDGANLINRSTPIAFIAKGKYWVNNHAHVLDGVDLDYLRYIATFINAIDLEPYVTGTAQPKMNQAKMNMIPIALPPAAEQKRIVARVDQLMALCDEAEARQAKRREVQGRFRAAALDAVRNADGPEAIAPAWRRVAEHFDELIDRPEDVGQLRQVIVDVAVSGRLVKPARWSAKRVREIIATLRHDGCDAFESSASESGWLEVPLELVLAQPLANGRSVPDEPNGFPVLRLSALRGKHIDFAEHKRGAWTAKDAEPFVVRDGDLLFVRGNGAIRLVGRACIASAPPMHVAFPDTAIRGRPELDLVEPLWLWYVWESCLVRKQIEGAARTTAGIYKISQDDLYAVRLPLPTLDEQRRIIAKIEHLIQMCDTLGVKLRTCNETAAKLAQAIVAELIAS
jgi:type I restriction enzyme S subunit